MAQDSTELVEIASLSEKNFTESFFMSQKITRGHLLATDSTLISSSKIRLYLSTETSLGQNKLTPEQKTSAHVRRFFVPFRIHPSRERWALGISRPTST